MRRVRVILLLAVLSLSAGTVTAVVSPALASSGTGYDISYPQCNGSFPASPAFGIVGVNGGLPFSANPCLGTGGGPSELQWAGMSAELYANTANPGPALSTHWPNGQTAPEQCNTAANPGSDTAQCAYDYGWNAAADSYRDAVAAYVSLGWAQAGAARTPVANAWWLDVETGNSWTADTAFNVDELHGEVDYLTSVGVASLGFYSTPSAWQTITGGTSSFAAYQSWIPGASSLSGAQANCAGAGVTGGGVALTQYPSGGFDADYQCVASSASLSFTTVPQTLTAGSPSAPMSVALAQPSSSATSISLTSTSPAGSFSTSPSGPWGSSLTLSVPAGSTASGSFYYSDTRSGQPLLTASASGYGDATQTEVVSPAALTTVALTPSSAQVRVGGRQSFTATGRDRFGNAVAVTPNWTVSSGLGTFFPNPGNPVTFTAAQAGNGLATASVGAISGQASITVTSQKTRHGAAHPSSGRPALAALISLPQTERCVRGRRLHVGARRAAAAGFVSLRVSIDGKPVAALRGRGLALGFQLHVPSAQRYAVTIVALTRAGRKITVTYHYRACTKRAADRAERPPTLLPARRGG
jgi:hypothetical protein